MPLSAALGPGFLGSGEIGDLFHVKHVNHQTVLFHVKHTVGSLSLWGESIGRADWWGVVLTNESPLRPTSSVHSP